MFVVPPMTEVDPGHELRTNMCYRQISGAMIDLSEFMYVKIGGKVFSMRRHLKNMETIAFFLTEQIKKYVHWSRTADGGILFFHTNEEVDGKNMFVEITHEYVQYVGYYVAEKV